MALIRGTQGNDRLNGTIYADDIYGFAGNDTIRAGSGADYVEAGDGNDLLYGDAGNDWLVGGRGSTPSSAAPASMRPTSASTPRDPAAAVTLDLSQTVSSADGPYSVATVRTGTGSYQERLYSIEDVLGSLGNDSITGNAGSNILSATGQRQAVGRGR
jgi:Ca2+-binding RTX toxin-like protein